MFARSLLIGAGLSLAAFTLIGCKKTQDPTATKATPTPGPAASPATAHKTFGAALGASPTVAIADVLKAPDKFADQTVTIEGNVRQACTRKGCWMELSDSADAASASCRVTFKDYGFFVPTDSAGSRAKVEAKVESKLVKPEMVAHLESEGATFADKSADGSAHEVRLVATGVEMWR
jgi:hypothetical protein